MTHTNQRTLKSKSRSELSGRTKFSRNTPGDGDTIFQLRNASRVTGHAKIYPIFTQYLAHFNGCDIQARISGFATPSLSSFPMPVIGHGIDLVETARIRRLHEQHGQHFLDRVFTPAEQKYCDANPKRYFEHLAARFAAKEAVLKVLGTGWRGGISWTDIEVSKSPSGQPGILLTGECARLADEMGITHWHISLSHIETHATASAIGIRQ